MRISGLAVSYPERVVTNEEILSQLRAHNEERVPPEELERILVAVRRFFRLCGSRERRWRAPGERSFDHAMRAAHRALDMAGAEPDEIDLLMYVGVGRGWLEPGMSHLFLDTLALRNATCFDVLDACLSWLRALQIAHQFLEAGIYRKILVMSAEFNIYEMLDWHIDDVDQVAWKFPGYTIGEAASATVLEASSDGPRPHFEFRTLPALHTLCKIPLSGIHQFSNGERCPQIRPHSFFSYGAELFAAALEVIPATFYASEELQRRSIDIGFTHQASATVIRKLEQTMGHPGKAVIVFPELGNTVSSSVPCSMAQALDDGRLRRGMDMMIAVASAGFSVGLGHLRF